VLEFHKHDTPSEPNGLETLAVPGVIAVDNEWLKNTFAQLCHQPASVIESETLEIKNWCNDEKKLAEKISEVAVCLANAQGGTILIGIEEEDTRGSKFSRCPYQNLHETWLVQRIHDNTVPPVEATAHNVSDILEEVTDTPGVNCFAITVPKTKRLGGHQTIAGMAKVRSGNECRPYYVAGQDDRTKAPVPGTATSDLNTSAIEWGMEQHHKKFGTPATHWESPNDFLLHTGLLETYLPDDEPLPQYRVSLAALLLFGNERSLATACPAAETIVESPQGTSRLRRNIVDTYRFLCAGRTALLPALCPDLASRTIQEVVVNALIHRSYRNNAPIIITVRDAHLSVESPGPLPEGLTTDSLIYCAPIYRNFLLAEGARYVGICDKVGKGIDDIYHQVLSAGFGFPAFESTEHTFTARIPLDRSRTFNEFLRRRSASLKQLDEIIILRYLFDCQSASQKHIARAMQRTLQHAHKILTEMLRKQMIEPVDSLSLDWRLTPVIRQDIEHIFQEDQYDLGFRHLYE
jgi:ATP-dependent DNA helicase RecG